MFCFRKKKVQPVVNAGPYRTAAEMPAEPIHEKPKTKVKRSFKMPSIKLEKHSKTFAFLMPVCGSAIGAGMLYDAPLLGVGFKWGAAIALVLVGAFFTCMTIGQAEKASKS